MDCAKPRATPNRQGIPAHRSSVTGESTLRRLYHPSAFDTGVRVASYWEDTSSPPALTENPEADGRIYDVAVVGGGYTGQSAALYLAKEMHMRVAIIDAGRVGWGASGRNGGFCGLGGSKLGLDQVSKLYGTEQAQMFVDAQRDAIAQVARISEEEQIDIERTGAGEYCFAHKKSRLGELQEEYALCKRFGIPVEVCSKAALSERGFNTPNYGALYFTDGFGVHPLKYCYGLYNSCKKYGVDWYHDTEALGWTNKNNSIYINTKRGSIRAKKLIVGTNGYTSENFCPELAGCMLPIVSNIVVTRPLTDAELDAQGWTSRVVAFDSKNLLHYFRLLKDNRVLFGGRGGVAVDPASTRKNKLKLISQFRNYFPVWNSVELEYYWAGFICVSYNLSPHVSCSAREPNVYYALAYHGSGVAMSTWSGRQVAKLATGQEHSIPGFINRAPKRFPAAFLRKYYLRAGFIYYRLCDNFL